MPREILPKEQIELFNAKRVEWKAACAAAEQIGRELVELGNGPWGPDGTRSCHMVFCCNRLDSQCKCNFGD